MYQRTGALTGLLLLGPAGGFVGLTPDSDAVVQQLQSSTLLPSRRSDLHKLQIQQRNLLYFTATRTHDCNQHYLHHVGALHHSLHILILLHPWKHSRQRRVNVEEQMYLMGLMDTC